MRITRLELRGVRRHVQLELRPGPGITVIRGPNEAGKSTIAQAVEMALFRRATSAAQEMQAMRSWGGADDPRIELELEHDGQPGRLVKVFAGHRGTVSLAVGGHVETDPARVDHILAELTGLPTEKFFRSTASVRHHELADVARDESNLRDRLQLSISGADRGTAEAKRALDDVIRRYRSEGPKNPGQLKQAREEQSRLRVELRAGETALTRLESDRAALAAARARCDELDAQLDHEQRLLAASEQAVELGDRREAARTDYERSRRACELRAAIESAEAAHPSSTPLARLGPGVERLKNLQFLLEELSSGLETELEPDGEAVRLPPPPRWQPIALIAVLLLAVAVAVLAIAAIIPQLGIVAGGSIAVLLALGGAGIAWLAWRRLNEARAVLRQNALIQSDIAARLRGRADDEERLRSTRRERDALLAELGLADVYAGEALVQAETAHVAQLDQLRAELKGLLGDTPPPGDLAAHRDGAAAEMERLAHALAGMGEIGADPVASRVRAQAAVRTTQLQRDQAISAEGQARSRVEENRVDAEQVATLAERVDAAAARLASLERRLRVYELTLRALEDAERATMKKAARYLEQRMGLDVATITEGRYRRVRVDEQDLAITVWSPERGDWVAATELSKGTLDQVYLAARLGLVRQVTQGRRPPLIFDDPFVTFDDDRARRCLELLRGLAADHQVLYLTTSDRYDAMADAVIELPAPTSRDLFADGSVPNTAPPALASLERASPDPTVVAAGAFATPRPLAAPGGAAGTAPGSASGGWSGSTSVSGPEVLPARWPAASNPGGSVGRPRAGPAPDALSVWGEPDGDGRDAGGSRWTR